VIAKLFDGTELAISEEAGQKLASSLQRSATGMVTVNGYVVKKSAIAYLKPGGQSEADTVKAIETSHRIQAGSRTKNERYQAARSSAESVRKILEKRGILPAKH
jgi:hypothetical protein